MSKLTNVEATAAVYYKHRVLSMYATIRVSSEEASVGSETIRKIIQDCVNSMDEEFDIQINPVWDFSNEHWKDTGRAGVTVLNLTCKKSSPIQVSPVPKDDPYLSMHRSEKAFNELVTKICANTNCQCLTIGWSILDGNHYNTASGEGE
jgi:hypothetical protein